MVKSAFERLSSDEAQLFTLVISHLVALAFFIGGLVFAELINQRFGPFPRWIYLLLSIAATIAFLFVALRTCGRAINKLLDLADECIRTPKGLQHGYNWVRRKVRRVERLVRLLIVVMAALLVGSGIIPLSGSADSEFFSSAVVFWVCLYASFVGLLLLGSWIAGRITGKPETEGA